MVNLFALLKNVEIDIVVLIYEVNYQISIIEMNKIYLEGYKKQCLSPS